MARLRAPHGFTELPPMRAVGATGDERLAFEVGALLGRELRAVGIDQDYAPVVDVDTNPANPVIGDRSFARDAARGGAPRRGRWRGDSSRPGVAACAKHFPGHGDTSQDSHHDLPRLPHALERLRAGGAGRRSARSPPAGVASVMTAHVVFEALDPVRPATLSPPVLQPPPRRLPVRRLRHLGRPPDEARSPSTSRSRRWSRRRSLAGVDALLVCHDAAVAARAPSTSLAPRSRSGAISRERLAAARRRVEALLRWAGPPPDPRQVRARLRTDDAPRAGGARARRSPPGATRPWPDARTSRRFLSRPPPRPRIMRAMMHPAQPDAASPRRALVCLPTYNERDNLEPITRAILAADPRVDILVIDDNSPDGTGELADALAAREPRVRVLHRAKQGGPGEGLPGRVRAGRSRAGYALRPRDGRGLLPRPALPAARCWSWRRRRGPGPGLAQRERRRHGELGRGPQAPVAAAARSTRGPSWALGVRDLTGGFKCFRRRGARGHRPGERWSAPATPSRSSSPTAPSGGASAWWRCPSCSRTGAWGSRRCPGRSSSRR